MKMCIRDRDWAGRRWESVSLRANSIGAYLAMLAWEDPARALLVSPILDMEELIRTMMGLSLIHI